MMSFTIFGGTGDLTFRKLLPAFYNLHAQQKLDDVELVVIGRRAYTKEAYCEQANTWIKEQARLPYRQTTFESLMEKLHYVQMDFTQEENYTALNAFYESKGWTQHIFYFAVAPRFFGVIANGLRHVHHACDGKVIIEKPFGEDRISAKQLHHDLEEIFSSEHIFHIDHYLGKEMVRNIQAVRFSNPIFQSVWKKEFIEHIQINAMETVGVESRGGYYDQSGALKDMVQNHLFQILTILAMEQPSSFFGEDMHQKQLDVLHSLRPVSQLNIKETMALGQYFNYQKEPLVQADSMTETYAALKLYIDNERWNNVPFYIRTGKKLDRREMEVIITFKKSNTEGEANVLMIKIQPTEGIYFKFNMKQPGDSNEIVSTSMDFCQSCSDINRINTPHAYERLLYAVIEQDSSWFSQWDQIETSWQYVEELKEKAKQANIPLYTYMAGSDGPIEANQILEKDHHWQRNDGSSQ